MRIRTKLLLGFGVMLLLISALAGIGIYRLTQLSHSMDEIYYNRYMKLDMAYSIRGNITVASRSLLNLILNDPDLDKAKEIKNANDSIELASKEFVKLIKTSPDSWESEQIRGLIEMGKKFIAYKDQVIKFVTSNQPEKALQVRKEMGIASQTELFDKLDQLVKLQQTGINEAYNSSAQTNNTAIRCLKILLIGGLLLGLGIMLWIIVSISNGLNRVVKVLSNYSAGNFEIASRIQVVSKDEIGEVSNAFNSMADELEKKRAQELDYNRFNDEQTWLKSNVSQMTTMLQSTNDLKTMAQMFMSEVAGMIGMKCGCFYLNEVRAKEKQLQLYGMYAFKHLNELQKIIYFGEGLVGQCALDQKAILIKEIPEEYMKIHSSLGSFSPTSLFIYPVLFENKLVAVLEMATLFAFTSLQLTLLDQLSVALSVTINRIQGRNRVDELLRISQALTDELQAQSEELLLQQNELKDSNKLLEEQILRTEQINKQIVKTKTILEQQTHQLAASSKYKSEFLAKMSHELRTPLNSMLILSQLLAENKEGNLLPKQIEFAQTVHSSGSDLMHLIDEILDLSKVEAGKIEITPELMSLNQLKEDIDRNFMMIAKKKNLLFEVQLDNSLPPTIYTDSYRVEQILNNLLSNAFKFTEHGSVVLSISRSEKYITFSVSDTGIGIPPDKLQVIFEAFQQEDGTTSRKYGGTGLGLSISKEFARLLGGKIEMVSEKGAGSTFTLLLPEYYIEVLEPNDISSGYLEAASSMNSVEDTAAEIIDNRSSTEKALFDGKKVLLVDDDIRNIFALSSVLESYNMKIVFAENGRQALQIVEEQTDFDLILMDLMMPEMDGYETIKLLREQSQYAEIPIIALTANAMNMEREKSIEVGASGYIAKPIHIEQLLILMSEKLR
jgi:two-component system chemotaxis sensor kinase CheA